MVVALGLLVAGGAPLTAAAFSDDSWLSFGSEGALGSTQGFAIGVVTDATIVDGAAVDGTARVLHDPDALDWPIDDPSTFVPGSVRTMQLPVFNDSPILGADVALRVERRSVVDLDIADYLTVTVRDAQTGAVLADGLYLDELAAAPVVLHLEPRGGDAALSDEERFTPGAPGSGGLVDVELRYEERSVSGAEDTPSLNGGSASLRIALDATSWGRL